MLSRGLINRILSKFPQGSFCFAYGSKVFPQVGYDNLRLSDANATKTSAAADDSKQKIKPLMIDLLFTVENPFQWHEQNLRLNPSHYSSMRHMGSSFIARYQQSYAAKVYCNTLIPLENDENLMVKYGCITTKDLLVDLFDWRDLYVAGRLHKPVKIIRDPINSKIQNALDLNLQSSLRASLLLLPKEFTELELFNTIASLSYNGDFRMIFGENKNKVQNIVKPQVHNFRKLYAPTIDLFRTVFDCPVSTSENADVLCRQDKSPAVILQHLNQLPKFPIRRIVRAWTTGRYRMDTEDVLRAVACSPKYQEIVRKSLADIVWQSSVKQSIKNIPTGGFRKSLEYAWSKAVKTLNL